MRWWIASLVLAVGCSSAASDGAQPRRDPATTTTTTTAPVPVTQARPTDEIGLRCQAVVDLAITELVTAGKAPPEVDGACRTREQEPLLGTRTGYSIGTRFVVRYPFDRVPEAEWESVWRDVAVHEIGHTWSRRLSPVQMQSYAMIRGLAGWDSEDYADVYAAVIGGAEWLGYIGTPPPAEQIAQLCAGMLLPC